MVQRRPLRLAVKRGRAIGDPIDLGLALSGLMYVRSALGMKDGAIEATREAVECLQRVPDRITVTQVAGVAAPILADQGHD